MILALAPHLQQGIAYRQGVSQNNYESFVKEVQCLAKRLESIPTFRIIPGSDKEYYTPENFPQIFQPASETERSVNRALTSSSRKDQSLAPNTIRSRR